MSDAIKDKTGQVVSKQRVSDHGEVFTSEREVNAMLDLVKHETERIDSRFLEPACGHGNFASEILQRKLNIVESKYGINQPDFERYSIIAVSSIYGIDIIMDNVEDCRNRLYEIFNRRYSELYGDGCKSECFKSIRYILGKNIVWGDALTLRTVSDKKDPIVFSEWSAVNGSMIKRRDFTFHGLLQHEGMKELPLFSDLGEDVFIPRPLKEYPLTHFLRLADVENG
jgi:hypothetical protein